LWENKKAGSSVDFSVITTEKKRKKFTAIYLIITIDGKPKWENTGIRLTGTKVDKELRQKAEIIKAKRITEIVDGNYSIQNDKDFLKYYRQVLDANPKMVRRLAPYKHLCNYAQKNNIKINFKTLTEDFWQQFRDYLVSLNHKQYTIETELSIIKTILNKAVRSGIINENPLKFVKERRPVTTRTYLTIEELRLLKETPCSNENISNAFFFSCYTGLRLGDVKKLTKADFINGYLNINMEKTGNDLYIPYPKYAMEYVKDFENKKPEELLFKLSTSSTISIIIQAWVKAAGINKNITFHSSRHTNATLHMTYGTSIEVLRDLLGHKDVRETQIYARIIDSKKVQAVNNLPEI